MIKLNEIKDFLVSLEKKFAGVIVFLIVANSCIFLYECNQGKMVESEPTYQKFVVKGIEYTKSESIIYVQEVKPLNSFNQYSLEVNLTKKELSKLNVKKGKTLLINTTVSQNKYGKQSVIFNEIKFNKKNIYTFKVKL